MPRLRNYCLVLAILIGTNLSTAQLVVPQFETLDVENGLSQNSVYRIYQDKRGFMWFGTADGLNRYDGENIRVFKYISPAITRANSNFIRGWISEDQQGRIWYANETGIYFFNPVKEKIEQAYDFLKEITSGFVYYSALLLDKNENLWLSNPTRGVLRFSIHSKQTTLFEYPESVRHNEFAIQPQPGDGYLYLHFSERKGVLRFNVYTNKYDWIVQEYANANVRTDNKELYLIQDNLLAHHDTLNREIQRIPLTVPIMIQEIRLDSAGRYWIGTKRDGLYVYLSNQKKFIRFHHDLSRINSLPADIITCLFIDADQNLWIGTDGGGVSRIDLKVPRFNIFPLSQSDYPKLKNYFIRCFYEDDRGRIWVGTLDDGLVIYTPKDGTIINFAHLPGDDNSLPDNSVGAILRDREGNIWVGHEKGLSLFDEKNKKFRHVPIERHPNVKSATNTAYQLMELSNGELMMSTFYGVYTIRKDGKGFYFGKNWKDLTVNAIGIYQANEKEIWVASQMEGLLKVDADEDSISGKSKRFLPRINLRSIHADEQDPHILWLCSGAGLIRFDTQTFEYTLYDEQHGIPGSFVYGLIEDDHHNFWLSTNSGLCFFDRKNETVQIFSVKDGLQSNEFNTGAFYKGPSGTIYFGGIKGFNWFKTGAEQLTNRTPRSEIISVLVNEIPITNDSTFFYSRSLLLPYHQNDLSFDFAVFDYTRPEANKIQYMLEGWDKQWITTYQKSARYSNLPHGNYKLRVRASGSASEWGKEDFVTITIQTPFWKANWFYTALSLILIGVIVGITRMVTHRKYEQKLAEIAKQKAVLEERDRISKDLHDDLGTGLSKISILSELARQSKGMDDFKQRQLEKISDESQELIDSLGELIWSNNPANDSLNKLLWHVREHLCPIFDGTNTVFQVSIPALEKDLPVPAVWRRNIYLAIKESLHNILKHAHATEASLEFTISYERLTIKVIDNGRGFDTVERAIAGNGLSNIRKRIQDCAGTVQFESKLGKGTSVRMEVPLDV